mmetsp:Transcript_32566/g.40363  ORF Transcript_32566/g.40363 Transcript_32566/m.40363 type:complete len:82 (-) Transcript_32566:413-658(-)
MWKYANLGKPSAITRHSLAPMPPQNRVLYHFCVAEYAQKKLIVTGGRFVVNHVVDEAEMAELPSRAVSIYSIEQDSWTGEA